MNVPVEIVAAYRRSCHLTAEKEHIRSKPVLSDADLKRLAEIQADLLPLCPARRYCWIDGKPVLDLWEGLMNLYGGAE